MKNSFHSISIVVLAFMLFLTSYSYSQSFEKKANAMLSEYYPSDEPGATILVAQGDKVIYSKAFGMADMERNVPNRPEMVFEIGSITKQFTAVCILMLMEKGKLSLDDDITKFIEDYPTQGHHISIHHLLTHTSGIKSYTSMEEWNSIWRKDFTNDELIDFFKNQPMDFAPGTEFRYNNSAYFLLGVIIEKVSGMTYPEFLKQRIFKPLGMDHSYYGSHRRIIQNRALGYQKEDVWKNAEFLSMTQPGAAGSIMSTVNDLYTWNKAVRDDKLISTESKQKAFTDYTLNNGEKIDYGYGWMPNEIQGSQTLEHAGGIFGYTSNGIWLPEENVYVVMLSNRDDKGPNYLSTKLAAMAIGKPYPEEEEKISVDDDILKQYVGQYEFEDGSVRYITFENGQLFSQRSGSSSFEIFPMADNKFFFKGSLASIVFTEKENNGMAANFKNRSVDLKGHRTSLDVPDHEVVQVSEAIMQQYVGVYEIQTGFDLTVTLEEGHLMTQATGQQKFEVFPESETRFFLKVVDAQIEFLKNDTGEIDALMLYQGGQEIRAIRKN
ncbi:MAG: serine hydrolase [Bacteroidetes bacterium]|nr:serine hydrolase [Bacteroidota bacterium]